MPDRYRHVKNFYAGPNHVWSPTKKRRYRLSIEVNICFLEKDEDHLDLIGFSTNRFQLSKALVLC